MTEIRGSFSSTISLLSHFALRIIHWNPISKGPIQASHEAF